jgi:hypothetical protein
MEDEKSFKVIDRRGSSEQEPQKVQEKQEQKVVEPSALDFASFVLSLAHQTIVLLGEAPNPETNLIATNLEAARQTIDILAMLVEKTVGNLTDDEKRLLEEVLAGLRLAYVKKSKIGV